MHGMYVCMLDINTYIAHMYIQVVPTWEHENLSSLSVIWLISTIIHGKGEKKQFWQKSGLSGNQA